MIVKNNLKIVFLGPPSSGKGTQAEMLAKRLKIPYLATGNIFRDHIKRKTKLGKFTDSLINKGFFVPDNITNRIVADNLKKNKKRFILDGYPRNLNQANTLGETTQLNFVFYIKISNQEAIRRIIKRRVCPFCNKVYHLKYNPPKKKGLCDFCEHKLIQRDDDKKEVMAKRLKIYHKDTRPLIKFYQKKGVLVEIKGEQPIEKVQRDILKEIRN